MSSILMYHSVSPDIFDPGMQVRPEAFRQQLHWVEAAGYRWASVEEVIAHPDGQLVALSFDDAFADNLPVFEWLAGQGIPAMLFVCPAHLGSQASWASVPGIRELPLMTVEELHHSAQLGVAIGSHSWQHRSFRSLSTTEIEAQLRKSQQWFSRQMGLSPDILAYPYGHCPAAHQTLIAEYFSTALAVEALPGLPFPLTIPRMPALEGHNEASFLYHLRAHSLHHFIR